MHILIPTDGTLNPDRAADAVERWYQEGDAVLVFTVMNIPTEFLRRLGDSGVKEAATIAHEAGQGLSAGDRAAERLARPQPMQAGPRGDSPVMKALSASAHQRTAPMVAALKAKNVPAEARWTTTDNKTTATILATIRQYNSGLIVIGSHGQGRFDGLLGSTGTKLVRHSPASVLVIRADDR